ncbi:hypothetical protein HDU85_002809 [Gaertneriomyces sp. JEL0708]|nr:hypothetical protein HDU85_002809 [Gaertneriomyces sp. JEL0708]
MNTSSFLFGNVDESGRLDADLLDDELREGLADENGYLSRILGGIGLDDSTDAGPGDTEGVRAADGAEDYSNIEELADADADDTPMEISLPALQPPILAKSDSRLGIGAGSLEDDFDEDYDMDATVDTATTTQNTVKTPKLATEAPKVVYDREKLLEIFPGYEDMRFSEIFGARIHGAPRPRRRQSLRVRRTPLKVARDTRENFHQPLSIPPLPKHTIYREELPMLPIRREPEELTLYPSQHLYPLMLERWEDRVLWEEEAKSIEPLRHSTIDRMYNRNYALEIAPWESHVLWDENDRPVKQLVTVIKSEKKRTRGGGIKRFNISGDRWYSSGRADGSDRVRQTHGSAILQHSLPAIKLHPAYFRHHLAKKDLRSFHRPAVRVLPGEEIRFSRVRTHKRKRNKGKDADMMKTTKDLTLKDTCRGVLLEYSEEYPMMMMNPGMGSLIYNYYRKTDEKDTTIPMNEIGTPNILDRVDASPFVGFGDVSPGETLQAISTNLFRAPIWKHETPPTDFLVIRHVYKGDIKWYIREMLPTFVVGQCFPLVEVPKPQSRKITQAIKGRLQATSFRLMRRDPRRLLKYDLLVKSFPGFTEPQLRQRLKEFAQFAKKGENTGWWKLKPGVQLLGEEEIRRLVTPEMVCLQESTMVGQQRLRDIGYSDVGLGEEENEEEEMDADVEVQLAPWTLTKNFIQASQNKSMIKLYGPGDPTGRGEGFSFIRQSMKEPFLRYGESYEERMERDKQKPKSAHRFSFAEQQTIYREEIERIWKAQAESLSSSDVPVDDDDLAEWSTRQEEMERDEEARRRSEYGFVSQREASMEQLPQVYRSSSTFADDETNSVAESRTTARPEKRLITIRRKFKNRNGTFEWRHEVITDVRVVNAYLRQHQLLEQELANLNIPSDKVREKKRRLVRQHVNKMKEQLGEKKQKSDEGGPGNKSRNPSLSLVHLAATNAARRNGSISGSDYFPQAKSYGRRRTSPLVDFSNCLEAVISSLIAIPDYYVFSKPVPITIKDYTRIVKKPRHLEYIRDRIRQFQYKTVGQFLEDFELIESNSRLYNGPNHPLTKIAEKLVRQGKQLVNEAREELESLEKAVKDEEDI